jgi:Tfp pilus assembly protein PilX
MDYTPRGFALILSIILTSVSLAIGLALLDVAYKQLIIATTAKQSGIAFYNADSAMECALYYDQKFDTFNWSNPGPTTINCAGIAVTVNFNNGSTPHNRTFGVTCPSGTGTSSAVTIYKAITGAPPTTNIYASGYNNCNASNPQRIERGLKSSY